MILVVYYEALDRTFFNAARHTCLSACIIGQVTDRSCTAGRRRVLAYASCTGSTPHTYLDPSIRDPEERAALYDVNSSEPCEALKNAWLSREAEGFEKDSSCIQEDPTYICLTA